MHQAIELSRFRAIKYSSFRTIEFSNNRVIEQSSNRVFETSSNRNIEIPSNRVIEFSNYRESEQSSHRSTELSRFRASGCPNHWFTGQPPPCAMPVRMQQHRLPQFVPPTGLPPSGAGVPSASSAPRHGQGCGRRHMDTGAHQVSPRRAARTQKKGAPRGNMSCGGALYHKKGGDLLSHIAVQYHRRARA